MQDFFIAGSDIVIVDDEPNNLSVLKGILAGRGHRVRPALSGELALKAVRRRPPDLILLDILMPGANGYEICAALKADPATCDVPVLFISALSDTEDKVKAFEAGGLDYISKPFRAEEVVARVEAHLNLRRMSRALGEQNELLRLEIEQRKTAQAALAAANRELEKLANLDGLTLVANRRFFEQTLAAEWQRAKREGAPLAMILADIDYFKRYNDTYGHLAGDDCLCKVARTLQETLERPSDLAARYGGEEFAMILPNTDEAGALHLAEAVLAAVRNLSVPHENSEAAGIVTLSLGVAALRPSDGGDGNELIALADKALYQAKEQGRNRALCA